MGRSKMAYIVLFAVTCASAAFVPAGAKEATINARVYATDSTVGNMTSVTAGQSFAINFLMIDQATRATMAPSAPSWGSVWRSDHRDMPVDRPAGFWYLTGTGLYTGATGYFQEINPYPAANATGPADGGAIINVTF